MLVFNEQGDGTIKVRFKGYLKDESGKIRRGKPLSILEGPYSQVGSKDFQSFLQKDLFSFPKPVQLLKDFFQIRTKEDDDNPSDIVLDFFAGSCSTAEAILELNKDASCNHRFICVQLPELTEAKSEAFKAGYKTIADIGKERIRRVIQKIKKEHTENADMFKSDITKQDLGFKVFKLQPSNFSVWKTDVEKTPEAIAKQLELNISHISPAATQEALLFELLLKSGFELTTPIAKETLAGKTVYSIAEGELLICLEKELTNELIKAMAGRKPSRVICLDEGFQNNDQLKTNAVQVMKSKGVLKFQTV